MGWSSTHRPKGLSTRDFLAPSYSPSKIIASASAIGVTYMAVEKPDGYVFGLVVLTRFSKDYYNFSHKEVSEDMGPFESDCPAKILNLLSDPPFNEYAAKWRERCRRREARTELIRTLKSGDVVDFAAPVVFRGGDKYERLFCRSKRRQTYIFEPVADSLHGRYCLNLKYLVNHASAINGQALPEA